MSEFDRWQTRFSAPGYLFGKEPNAFVKSKEALIRTKAGGKALSIADGEARNGVFIAQCGLDVLSRLRGGRSIELEVLSPRDDDDPGATTESRVVTMARGLGGLCQGRAHHAGVGAAGDGLGEVASVGHAAVGDHVRNVQPLNNCTAFGNGKWSVRTGPIRMAGHGRRLGLCSGWRDLARE